MAGDPACGGRLGNYVYVLHADTSITIYGHLMEVNVSSPAVVTQGQLLGRVGNTGDSRSRGPGGGASRYREGRGYHLHYDVRTSTGGSVGTEFADPGVGRPALGSRPVSANMPVPAAGLLTPAAPQAQPRDDRPRGAPAPAPEDRSDSRGPFLPPPGGGSAGALAASGPQPQELGGVDLSQVTLRYLAVPAGGPLRGVSYVVRAPRSDTGRKRGVGGEGTIASASASFLTWLALDPATFTANLNPREPDRIMDRQLASTEAGRVILEADLRMKRTVGRLIHPDRRIGRAFWARVGELHGAARRCLAFRQWIVPARATVAGTSDAVYIVRAPLRVRLEQEYLGRPEGSGRCKRNPAARAVLAQYRGLVLPKVEAAVNDGREYAALRRVFHSRVAAEWYRRRGKPGPYDAIVDSGRLEGLKDRVRWSPLDTYRRYVRSLRDGEFNIRRTERRGQAVGVRTYLYGGVDLSRLKLQTLSPERLAGRQPALPAKLLDALVKGQDRDAGGAWIGDVALAGETTSATTGARDRNLDDRPDGGVPIMLILGAGALLGALGVWIARTRARRRPGRHRRGASAAPRRRRRRR